MNVTPRNISLSFTKMEGLGNDFIVIDDRQDTLALDAGEVSRLCDRHFGIGADGLILLRDSSAPGANFSWDFFNADGSVAEMCGNGIRCIGAYLAGQKLIDANQNKVAIQTRAGLITLNLLRDEEGQFRAAEVDMGRAVIINESLVVANEEFFCVSMGNPHAITFVADLDCAPVTTFGPRVERDEAFPAKTNVEFAQVIDRATLRLRVWERGAGETLACGTGACATAVAAYRKGFCDERITVRLPGGPLDIAIDPATLQVMMTGPARAVFVGSILL